MSIDRIVLRLTLAHSEILSSSELSSPSIVSNPMKEIIIVLLSLFILFLLFLHFRSTKAQRVNIQQTAHKYNSYLNYFSESMNQVVFSVRQSGEIESMSSSAKRFTGLDASSLIGRSIRDIGLDILPMDFIASDLRKIRHQKYEKKIVDHDGREHHLEITLMPNDGSILGVARDMRDDDKNFRSFIEAASDGIIMIDEKGMITEWNHSMEELTGFRRNSVIGRAIWSVVFYEPRNPTQNVDSAKEGILQFFRTTENNNGAVVYEGVIVNDRGEKKYIEASQSKLRSTSGTRMIQIVRDISDRHRPEIHLDIKDFLNDVSDLIQSMDAEGRILYVNRKWIETLGYGAAEVRNLNFIDMLRPDQRDVWRQIKDALLRGESVANVLLVLRKKDGGEAAVEGNINAKLDANRILSIRCIFTDVSDKLSVLEALRQSEQRYMDLYDNAPDMYFTIDLDGTVQSVNKCGAEYLGYRKEELIGEPVWNVIHPEDIESVKDQIQNIISGVRIQSHLEFRKLHRDGSVIFVTETVKLILGSDDHPKELRILCSDKTEQLLALSALKESEQKYRTLIEQSNDAIYLLFEDRFEMINKRFEEILGYSQAEVHSPDFNIMNLVAPESRALVAERREKMISGKEPRSRYEFTAIAKNGREIEVEVSVSHVEYLGGTATQGVLRNVTERKRMEQALRESEYHFRSVFEGARDAILVESVEGDIFDVNRAACELYGYSRDELIRMHVRDLLPPEMIKQLPEIIKIHQSGKNYYLRMGENVDRNGLRIPVEVSTSVVKLGDEPRVITIVRDVRERKSAEIERMDAIRKTVSALAKAVELRDPYTFGHSNNVAIIAERIAKEFGWETDRVLGLRLAAELHDIGKIAIPAEILAKPAQLTDLEYSIVKEHAAKGYGILKDIRFPFPVAEAVHQHHELLDGSGYPQALQEEDIIMEARIICVADVLETFTSHRPYRPALGMKKALEKLKKDAGILYDEQVVEIVMMLIEQSKGKPFWKSEVS